MTVTEETCYLCGKSARFIIDADAVSYREAVCEFCGANIRNSDIAKVIAWQLLKKDICLQEATDHLKEFKILGTCSSGMIHSMLKQLPGYIYGEYFDDILSGEIKDGILCIDLKKTPFESEYFDLVITEDVLEHIDDVNLAFKEINRILKPHKFHVFTVPLHENRRTLDRTFLKNKVYHGDPLRSEGAFVFTDFGNDLECILDGFGMKTEQFMLHQFFAAHEISNVDLEYNECTQRKDQPLRYFKYNSVVFCSTKIHSLYSSKAIQSNSQPFTGERFIPGLAGEITSEHVHRYCAAAELVKDKVVLDAACGEGYGSFMMSQYAQQVVGIDIDEATIFSAQEKYISGNLVYINASISQIPLADHTVDAVISFETIEHVSENSQISFLQEIKRVLKPDGFLIISTPDKHNYSDKHNYVNSFHTKEFYFDEFRHFLLQWFSQVSFYNHGFENVSLISSCDCDRDRDYRFINQHQSWKINKKYTLAICSNSVLPQQARLSSFMFQDGFSYDFSMAKIDELYEIVQSQAQEIENQKRKIMTQNKRIGQYVCELAQGKKVVFFGTGSAVPKIQLRFPCQVDYYVDNNQDKWGSDYKGWAVYSPEQLLQEDKEQLAIIVASQYFEDISGQLTTMGFQKNINFWNGCELFIDAWME